MNILSIETSCDETALALVGGERQPQVLINLVSSQIDLHRKTQGIVPEVAAREQLAALVPMWREFKTELARQKITLNQIDAIGVTKGPGLIGSLLVGVEAALTIGELWQKPVYGIHHVEGHIYGAFSELAGEEVEWPVIALVVSGGHTQLVLMRSHFNYEIIGTTKDDAAGEAFDKTARLLGLSYPGGPAIAKEAEQADAQGWPALAEPLPRPMLHHKSLDFSFSGLKTALYYRLLPKIQLTKKPAVSNGVPGNVSNKNKQLSDELFYELTKQEVAQYAREVQEAIVEILVKKTERAVEQFGAKTVVVVGGVSANSRLRASISDLGNQKRVKVIIPPLNLTTDNAGMIGLALWHRLNINQLPELNFEVKPRLALEQESVLI